MSREWDSFELGNTPRCPKCGKPCAILHVKRDPLFTMSADLVVTSEPGVLVVQPCGDRIDSAVRSKTGVWTLA